MNEGSKENLDNKKELAKALTFLFSKEAQEFSMDDKRQFLLTKLPEGIVNQAIKLYPQIKNLSIGNQYKHKQSNGIFESLFDVGIISSAILSSLLLNFLFEYNTSFFKL